MACGLPGYPSTDILKQYTEQPFRLREDYKLLSRYY
jgi:hypothetical protein